jgi:virginiamycin B lyase
MRLLTRTLMLLTVAVLSIATTSVVSAAPSDVATIRALRLENNRAIASRNVALMRAAYTPNIRLMDSDGTLYLGANAVTKTYADNEFKDPHFVTYVRRPSNITISADGSHAAEYGAWTGINTAPEHVYSGTYLASWQKRGGIWKIVYEAFSELDLAPQNVVDALHPTATFALGGTPDWLAVTKDSVWISNDALKAVQRVDVRTNTIVARIKMPGAPCSGLAYGFGSLWVPLCGAHPSVARVDPARNVITAILPIGPALSEGGITISGDSVWLVTGNGVLSRIDPTTNHIRQNISIAHGSYNPLFSDGTIWVTSGEKNTLTALDASSGNIIATVPVGSKPHFLTAGEGMVWTLNQGDGSVSKVDAKTKRVVATIDAGAPGGGGDIAYGAGSVWSTIISLPLTRIDAHTSAIRGQWGGRGGDAVRFGHQSIWLTDYFNGRLWRIPIR